MHGMSKTKMTTQDKKRAAVERIKEAENARDELKAELHSLGVVLPSLDVECAAYGGESPRPLLELGRCNVHTARKLTAALRALKG